MPVLPPLVQAFDIDAAAFLDGIDKILERVNELADTLDRVAEATDRAARAASGNADIEERLGEVVDAVTQSETRLSESLDAMFDATERTTAAIEEQTALLRDQAAAADESAASNDRVSESAVGMGSKGKMAFLGLAVGAAIAVKAAGDYQQQTDRLVTSAGESARNLKMVQSGILAMSSATNTSLSELTKGAYIAESAGFHGAHALTVLRAAAEGAQAEGADLSVVTNAVTSALNAYGLKAGDAMRVTNMMVTAVGQGKMTMQDLAGALAAVLPVAAAAHLSFQQVTGAIATMTSQGMSANEASQLLRHTIVSLQNPSNVQIAEMQQLGINSNKLAKNIGKNGLTGTIQELEQAILRNMGPSGMVLLKAFNQSKLAAQSASEMIGAMPPALAKVAKAYQSGSISVSQWNQMMFKGSLSTVDKNLLQQFATVSNASKGFNNMLKSGRGDAQTFTAALSKVMGGAEGLQVAMMTGGKHIGVFDANVKAIGRSGDQTSKHIANWSMIQHQFNFELGSAIKGFEAAGVALGTALLPAVSAVIHPIASFMTYVSHSKAASIALAAVVGGILSAVLGVKMVTAFSSAEKAVTKLGEGLIFLAGKFGLAAGAEDAEAVSAGAAAGATSALDAVLDAAGIGLVIMAIAALVVGLIELYKHSLTVRNMVKEVGVYIKYAWTEAMMAAGRAIKDFESGPLPDIQAKIAEFRAWWQRNHEMIETIAKVVWDMISTTVRITITLIVGIVKIWLDIFLTAWRIVWAIVSNVVLTIWRVIYTVISSTIHEIGDVFSIFADVFTGKWSAAWSKLKDLASTLWHEIVTVIEDILKGLVDIVFGIGKAIVEGLINGIKAILGALWGVIKDIGSGIVNGLKDVLHVFSPSKKMYEIGVNIVEGLYLGIHENAAKIQAESRKLGAEVLQAFNSGEISSSEKDSLLAKIRETADRDLHDLASQRRSRAATFLGVQISNDLALGLGEGAGKVRAQARRLLAEVNAEFAAGKISATEWTSLTARIDTELDRDLRDIRNRKALLAKELKEFGLELTNGIIRGLTARSVSTIGSTVTKLLDIVKSAFADGAIGANRAHWLTTWLEGDNAKLRTLGNERNELLKKIAEARKYASQTASNTESWAGLANVASNIPSGGAVTGGALLAGLQRNLATIRRFNSALKRLARLGLDKNLLNQLIQAGPDAGLQMAEALLDGPVSQIKALNQTQTAINQAATQLGRTGAEAMYDSGAAAGKGFLSGLEAQRKHIEKLMADIAKSMVRVLRKELGIKSPSTVAHQHGFDFIRGLANGLRDGRPLVDAAMLDVTKSMSLRPGGLAGAGALGGSGARTINLTVKVEANGIMMGTPEELAVELGHVLQPVLIQLENRNPTPQLAGRR